MRVAPMGTGVTGVHETVGSDAETRVGKIAEFDLAALTRISSHKDRRGSGQETTGKDDEGS